MTYRHMVWVAPTIFVAGAIFSAILERARRPIEFWIVTLIVATVMAIVLSDLIHHGES